MLKRLFIQNYALIEKLEIQFSEGLSIITGETGAGKSILLDAFSLILGERANLQSVKEKTLKCIVEGEFDVSKHNMKYFFAENNLDYHKQTIIRREINPSGISRAFINDTPVNLTVLKQLAQNLVDINSQHESILLTNSDFQRNITDSFAQNEKLLEEYKTCFLEWKKKTAELEELLEKEKQSKADEDYFRFLLNEFELVGLKSGELSALEEEQKMLENAEEIKAALAFLHESLNGLNENNVLSVFVQLKNRLQPVAKYSGNIQSLLNRINSTYIELQDIASEAETEAEKTDFNPERLNEINLRLDSINKLLHKHRVSSIAELMETELQLNEKLKGITSLEKQIANLLTETENDKKKLHQLAEKISDRRKQAAPKIVKGISDMLKQLAMPYSKLDIVVKSGKELTENGFDVITFLFSANKGIPPAELQMIASGGELSRLLLALKSLAAKQLVLPTVVFDEIDTGVSGDVADKVGKIMRQMADKMQVIAITHLPQIAVKAQRHFYVYKVTENKNTYTAIKHLDDNERITEIAKMLSGDKVSDAAMKNALELLKLQAN